MVIAEYITSGILEQYVSGTATPQERQEVECMSKIYPEIKAELEKMEQALEAYAMTMAVQPPSSLKAKIFEAIEQLPKEAAEEKAPTAEKPETKIVAMPNVQRWKYMAAASVAALILSAGVFWNQNQQQAQALADLNSKVVGLEKDRQDALAQVDAQKTDITVLTNPDNKVVLLNGVPQKDAKASMRVYWNQKTKELYVGQLNLPAAPSDKQYQLWALADGKPIDMGVFDESSTALVKMKTTGAAQAFAVTLEPKGGSVSPTLSEMYVIGNI